jgi:uncharacterized protein (DUF885 family)
MMLYIFLETKTNHSLDECRNMSDAQYVKIESEERNDVQSIGVKLAAIILTRIPRYSASYASIHRYRHTSRAQLVRMGRNYIRACGLATYARDASPRFLM